MPEAVALSSTASNNTCTHPVLPTTPPTTPPTETTPPAEDSNRPGPPRAKPRTFLFIDARSDLPQNQGQKQAYLLKKYHRNRKQVAIDRLKSSKDVPFDRRGLKCEATSHKKNGRAECDDPICACKDADSRELNVRSKALPVRDFLGQSYIDPFGVTGVEMSDSMNLYFHHFRYHTTAACYPLDSVRISMGWWQKAITQPALLRALLFFTAGHQATLESNNGISQTAQKSLRDSLQLRGGALQTLNDIMRDPIKAVAESTTLVVASLVAMEAVGANFVALDAHQQGLKRLVHMIGSLDVLDHFTLSKIYQSDVKSAALRNTRPIFTISRKWRDEILPTRTNKGLPLPKSLSYLGCSFFTSPWSCRLDPTMIAFLQIAQRLILHYETAQLYPEVIQPTDNDPFLIFEHQLLSTQYTTPTTPNPKSTAAIAVKNEPDHHELTVQSISPLNEPLRLTLIIYLNFRIWHFQCFPFMSHMVTHLQHALIPLYKQIESTAPTLLFWILFVGGMASQGYKCHGWFVNGLIDLVKPEKLDLGEWEDAKSLLEGFFYTRQAWSGEELDADLWNEVLLKAAYPYIAPRPRVQVFAV
ncbi:hypothetical protein BJX64DRAFT_288488 [Aspergillus heterothallicus]